MSPTQVKWNIADNTLPIIMEFEKCEEHENILISMQRKLVLGFLDAKAQTIQFAEVNYGNAKDVIKKFVGRRVLMIWLIYVIVVGMISKS